MIEEAGLGLLISIGLLISVGLLISIGISTRQSCDDNVVELPQPQMRDTYYALRLRVQPFSDLSIPLLSFLEFVVAQSKKIGRIQSTLNMNVSVVCLWFSVRSIFVPGYVLKEKSVVLFCKRFRV